jgi:hypothetical protein
MTSTEEEKKKFKVSEIMMEKFKKFTKDGFVDAKTFSAFTCITFQEMYELFFMLKGAYEGLIELDNDITAKIGRLDKLVQEIGNQSGSNIAKIVEEINGVKKTLKEPMFERLDRFITKLKEEAEKRDKAGETYID